MDFKFVVLDANVDVINWIIRILIAAMCGFCIGLERKTRSKEAGIRTHSIVCFASALIMVISKYAFSDQVAGENGIRAADAARIAAQVISGIGFLGAGIIFYKRDILHGLTTAAGIWATSAIGLAVGAGLIIIGVCSTAILIVLQILLHRPWKFMKSKFTNVLKISIVLENPEIVEKITTMFNVKKYLKFKTNTSENGTIIADLEVVTLTEFSEKDLYNFTKEYTYIRSIEKTEEM